MKLLHKIIRAIERNSRQQERRWLHEELDGLYVCKESDVPRVRQIFARLEVLAKADLQSDMDRNRPVKSVSQMVQEDDCGVPDGLVGELKAPV